MKTLVFTLSFLLFYVSNHAQSCTGSLGDQIINFTFGNTAVNPGPALAPGVTDLLYTTSPCPPDGSYTIVNSTNGCFNGGWVTMNDHTGDANGCFMLVNASLQPNTFYTDTINNLCEGITYEFGAWVINVVNVTGNYIEPELTFSVRSTSGAVLQTNNTGNIPRTGTQWNYYSFNFTNPPGSTSVVFSIRNNAPGGSGNDLAIDDINLRPVGPGIDVGIQGYPTDTISFCGTVPPLTLTSVVDSCYPVTVYQWLYSANNGASWTDIAGANSPTYNPAISTTGTYLYRLAASNPGNINNTQCRVLSSVLVISYTQGPSITATPSDTTVCPGSTVVFTASGGNSYQWSNSTQGAQNQVTVNSQSFYVVSVTTNTPGCIAVDTVYANVYSITPPTISQQTAGQCGNDTAILTATAGTAYLWSNNQTTNPIRISPIQDTTYTVTVTDVNGCTATASATTSPSAGWGITPSVVQPPCTGVDEGAITLSASGNISSLKYIWSTGDTTTQLSQLAPGMYSVSVTDDTCQAEYTFTLTYGYTLEIDISPQNASVAEGTKLGLQAVVNANNGNQYVWWPAIGLSCSNCQNPVVSVDSGEYAYILTVTDQYGCEAEDSVLITSYPIPYVFIPSGFSPNGDGNNDYFEIFGTGDIHAYMNYFSVKIFNRWGEKVYEALDPAFKWNGTYKGTALPPAVYVYLIDYVMTGSETPRNHKGSLTLIR